MSKKTLCTFVSHSIAAVALCAAAMLPMAAQAATWTGGASGTLNDTSNWDGDISTSAMNFTNNCTVALNADLDVYQVFGNQAGWNWWRKNIVFDLGGYTLCSTNRNNSGVQSFDSTCGSTFTFQHGLFLCVSASCATNSITMASAYRDGNEMTIAVTGADTTFVGSFQNRCTATTGYAAGKLSPGNRLLVLDGAKAYGVDHYFAGHCSTNEVSGGAALFFDRYCEVGSFQHVYTINYGNSWHDDVMIVDGGTLSARNPASSGTLSVGYGQSAHDNAIVARNGATVVTKDLYVGAGDSTNNTLLASGAGTTLSATTMRVGTRIDTHGPSMNNMAIVENGATASVQSTWIGAGGNALVVRSGATFEETSGGTIQLASNMTDAMVAIAGGAIGSRIEIVGATVHYLNDIRIGSQNVTNHVYGHEVFVGAGGMLYEKSIYFYGVGDRLVVSNGTVNVSGLNMGSYGGNHNMVCIMGESASFKTSGVTWDGKSAIFEFAIPETPWTDAPFRATDNFTIPADFMLRLDEAALKACRNRMREQGESRVTMPLMQAKTDGGAAKTITISDMTALSANLPEGCSLSYADGILSLKATVGKGLSIFVR